MQQRGSFVEQDSQKGLVMIKIIKKLETIATLQVSTEVQHKIYVILVLMWLTKFL